MIIDIKSKREASPKINRNSSKMTVTRNKSKDFNISAILHNDYKKYRSNRNQKKLFQTISVK
jgi:hypothetical protein